MSSTSQPTTFLDLYTDLLDAVRESTTASATVAIAKRYINRALHDMHIGSDFDWAIRRATLITHPTYTTGTVTISQGDTAMTGASTLWNTANTFGQTNARVGGKMTINGVEVYDVSAVGSDTAITLGSRFIPASVSSSSYTYFEDEYALASDFFQPVDKRQFTDAWPISLIGSREFYRRYPRNTLTGTPKVATILMLEPSGSTALRPRVLLHPAPASAMVIPYRYITNFLAVTSTGSTATDLVNNTDEPIVPLRYRHAIVYHAKALWYEDRKDDSRSQQARADYAAIVSRIRADTTSTSDRPRLRPRLSRWKPVSRRQGHPRYDVHGEWDRME